MGFHIYSFEASEPLRNYAVAISLRSGRGHAPALSFLLREKKDQSGGMPPFLTLRLPSQRLLLIDFLCKEAQNETAGNAKTGIGRLSLAMPVYVM
jgi:hypothetical protein